MSIESALAAQEDRLERARRYFEMREDEPQVPANKILAWLKDDHGVSFHEFMCPGHEWACTGTIAGGDDESYHGEGRVYCIHCGADGDA